MAVNTEADDVADQMRKDVRRMCESWAGMVTETISGSADFNRDYRRRVFEKLLDLRDMLE
jgi:hypothetical protein